MGKHFEGRWSGEMVPDGAGGMTKQMIVDAPDVPIRLSRPQPTAGTIYFVGPQGGPIKIGFATRLAFRIRDLRLANALPLEIWASVEGPPSLEREYHKRFASHRLHGEWFEPHPDILAEIARLTPSNGSASA
jgi:hypothetical protein